MICMKIMLHGGRYHQHDDPASSYYHIIISSDHHICINDFRFFLLSFSDLAALSHGRRTHNFSAKKFPGQNFSANFFGGFFLRRIFFGGFVFSAEIFGRMAVGRRPDSMILVMWPSPSCLLIASMHFAPSPHKLHENCENIMLQTTCFSIELLKKIANNFFQ